MLATGISTRMVFSTTVQLISIMLSSWLDHQMMLGPSRTAGEEHGEKTDTSDWPREILAMCASVLPTPSDHESNLRFIIFL